MTQAQQWLDSKYNNKQSTDDIKLLLSEELSGEIKIESYTNVKIINLVRLENGSLSKGKIAKVIINNCPALEKVILGDNEITAIVFEGDFPNLTQLEVQGNQLKEIELSKLPNLEFLNIARNPIDSQGIEKGLKVLGKLKFVNLLNTPGFNLKNMTNDDHADWINPNDKAKLEQAAKGAGFIDPKDNDALNKAADGQGKTVINKTELNNLKNNQEKHTDYDQIKSERDKWISVFPSPLTPTQVKAEYDKPKETHKPADLKPTDYDAIKNELERWKKLGQNPEKVAQDIKDLQSRPATGGTALNSAEQFDYLVVRAYLRKNEGNNWRKVIDEWKSRPINVSYIENSRQYFAQIEQKPK